MANIKELKKKIKSTKSTLKITTAMKLVSAAKLAKSQAAILGARPYAEELDRTVKTISALSSTYKHPYFIENKKTKEAHLVVISSNKGLCGGYNAHLVREVRIFLNKTDSKINIHYIGKKARELLYNEEIEGKQVLHTFEKQDPTYSELKKLALNLAKDFQEGKVGHIFVAYDVFHSAMSFTPTLRKLLPMTVSDEEKKSLRKSLPFDFKYEPQASQVLDSLVPQAYISTINTCLLDAFAAEHGSRMSSMNSAANNCKDLIKKLTLKANKLRQAAITTELIEVVSGAESLNA